MSDSIWGQPAPAARSAPAPIDTSNIIATYNLNATPTSADSNITRLLPCTTPHTPLSDTNTLTAEEMRALDKAAHDRALRAKFREVAERKMSEAASRAAYPQLYIDAPPPTKVWPWGGVVGSEAVKQLQIRILASLAGGARAATDQQNDLTAPTVTGASIARAAAAAGPVDETTPMNTTPAAIKTAPRTSAYPRYPQPSHVQRGPIEPKKADLVFVSRLAKDIEEAYPSFSGINNMADMAIGMRQVSALLYRDSFKMGGSKIRGQMIVDASPVAEQVNFTLKHAFDQQYPNQVTQRTLDMEALAAMLEEGVGLKETKVEEIAPLPPTSAAPPPVPNLATINDVLEGLLDIFPNLVATLPDMVSGMREVAAMLQRDVEDYGSTRKVSASVPMPTPAAKEVHSILLSTFQEQRATDAQKVCDIGALAKSMVEQANAFVQD